MIARTHLLAASVAAALSAASPCHAVPEPDRCHASEDMAGTVADLPHVAPQLKTGNTLHVLAVGSATMFGPNASLQPGTVTSQSLTRAATEPTVPPAEPLSAAGSDAAFPRQMANALQAAIPGLKVDVTFRGGRGISAAMMLDLMRAELKPGAYQLVLWQTGTVEAVRNTPPGEFAETLSDGVEAVEAAGADLVLIDPQYSRFLQTNSNLDPYTQALEQTASIPGVVLFHRFDLMHNWANEGQIDLERTAKPDRLKTVELLHQCLGLHLARLVLAGARN